MENGIELVCNTHNKDQNVFSSLEGLILGLTPVKNKHTHKQTNKETSKQTSTQTDMTCRYSNTYIHTSRTHIDIDMLITFRSHFRRIMQLKNVI